ncbi:MAG: hypothetical protein M3R35_03555 [Candidatus Eremiobacteraeota bacterium]|nr:hypothetical protein [Candidatus Eremiobacteraeota bacterium]
MRAFMFTMRRDPSDPRPSRRVAGSFLASLLLHALAALTLISLATSSSEQSAPENIAGSEIVTVTNRQVARTAPAVAKPAPPVPKAPIVAPPRARIARPAHHPRILHELSVNAPTAPPNPTPAPEASAAPNPQPTQEAIVASPLPFPPAVPKSVPTAAAVAVTIKAPPTAVPPAPAPATAAPARTAAPAAPKAPAPLPKPSAGVPSPGPTTAPKPSANHGTTQTPGPKPVGSPGPRGESVAKAVAAPKPVQLAPTPSPAAHAQTKPVQVKPKPAKKPAIDINARLRSLIPTGPVNSTTGIYHADLGRLNGRLEPTPPPEILAQTKYLYEQSGKSAGLEARIKMYVTSVHRSGPLTTCTGWLLKYPRPERSYGSLSDRETATGRVDPSGSDFGSSSAGYTTRPAIEENVTYLCNPALLTPFVAPSP